MYLRYENRVIVSLFGMSEEYPPFAFPDEGTDPGTYPDIRVDVDSALEERNRLTVAFRFILVIPHMIVLALLGIVWMVVALIGWFAVLFTGRWPAGLKRFTLGYFRWGLRVGAYQLLIIDDYPPFSLD